MKLDSHFVPLTRPETMKLLEEKMGIKLFDMGLGNDFFDTTHTAEATQ